MEVIFPGSIQVVGVTRRYIRGRRSLACDAAKSLGGEWIDASGPSKSGFIDNPQATVLLPGKVAQKMIFGINVESERTGTEEGVKISKIRKLTQNLSRKFSKNLISSSCECVKRERKGMFICCYLFQISMLGSA